MTGAGKAVIVADLLAQTGHRFGFRLIVEEGLSNAVLTQTQGCEPVIINPSGLLCFSKREIAHNNCNVGLNTNKARTSFRTSGKTTVIGFQPFRAPRNPRGSVQSEHKTTLGEFS